MSKMNTKTPSKKAGNKAKKVAKNTKKVKQEAIPKAKEVPDGLQKTVPYSWKIV